MPFDISFNLKLFEIDLAAPITAPSSCSSLAKSSQPLKLYISAMNFAKKKLIIDKIFKKNKQK